MKIGILNFHRALNYGAVLQCYGLQETLTALGHEVSVIDYRPRIIEKHRSYFLFDILKEINLYLQPIVTQYLVCNKSEIWP